MLSIATRWDAKRGMKPSAEMASRAKAGAVGDRAEGEVGGGEQLGRVFKPQPHHVPHRRHAGEASKLASKVVGAEPDRGGEIGHADRVAEVVDGPCVDRLQHEGRLCVRARQFIQNERKQRTHACVIEAVTAVYQIVEPGERVENPPTWVVAVEGTCV